MSETSDSLLVDLLIKEGVFTQKVYTDIVKKRPQHETSIRSYLIKSNIVTEEEILKVLSKVHGFPIANLSDLKISKEIINKISLIHVTSYQIFPLREENGAIIIGMVDVLDPDIFDDLRFCFSFPFKVELLTLENHKELVNKYYYDKFDEGSEIKDSIKSLSQNKLEDSKETEDIGINAAPVVVLLNNILLQAINDHASDIHFEPFEEEFKIRYRIDGTLYEMIPPPRSLAVSVLSRIKVMAKMNIAEKRVPQDGKISLNVNNKLIDLRVSTIPTAFGESAVLRVLDRSHIELKLDTLGMNANLGKKIRNIIHKPNGIFIATGPTGAGKTTTLYSCLRELNTIENKIITVEDPVEYDIDGITQVPINENIGLTFPICLRSILRQDPDNIMVGEIRDIKTMNMAIQASLTGHLVLSTLHTNDAASALTRLIDMRVEPFLICSSLEAVLAQRLVRKICTNCKQELEPNPSMLKLISLTEDQIKGKSFYKGEGCNECNGIGYKGRIGIFELLVINDKIRNLIMQKATANMIKECAIKHGMITILYDGINKIQAGDTTIEEVAACSVD